MGTLSNIQHQLPPIQATAWDSREDRKPRVERWGFVEWFVVSQTAFPALLYLPGTQPLRVPIRIAAFAISFAALGLWLLQGRHTLQSHPSRPWLVGVVVWLAMMVFHPSTNTLVAGLAQTGLYLSICAPLFWAPDMVRTTRQLRRLLAIWLVCNGINACVGVLQVYDPDRWLPNEYSTIVQARGGPLTYTGVNGLQVVRPPGLSDVPGAVCAPAAAATVLGVIFCLDSKLAAWRRVASFGFAFAGACAIYLSHVRSSLIVLAGSLLAYGAILVLQRRRQKAAAIFALTASVIGGGLLFAVMLGGIQVFERFALLFAEDPSKTYYASRGNMVDQAVRVLLIEYPLGAGLGRWGMMRAYFGDEHNVESPMIWAEVQWPAWILDGGMVLLVLYLGAIAAEVVAEYRFARSGTDTNVQILAAAVFAVNLGTLALLFSYTPFVAPIGMQYWFLAGSLWGVAKHKKLLIQGDGANGDLSHSCGGFRHYRRDGPGEPCVS
jgi:hypothetical protein